ncbi:MAG: acetamidase/formamidase family protein [Gemmatimonadetes bacterium]|nr:acetamidase/formamidase family protein [Gemmatimonadota bacterium]
MPNTLISVDLRLPPEEQYPRPHNRWHPEIPAVASVDPGTVFRLECLDLTGGQVLNSDSADDVRDLDLGHVHYLSGPVAVNGARPGDLLVVDILDIGPLAGAEWGFTGILDKGTGTGLLMDEFAEARKAIWDLNGIYATSRHVEGVRFVGLSHPGAIGCAPSAERLARWNHRELAMMSTHGSRFMSNAVIPTTEGALLGQLADSAAERVGREAARTWAARENGGNVDVKELSRGSRAYLPVYVDGGHLSVGDLQFSQGDGKITGLGGIKMAGFIDLHVDLIRGGMERFGISNPVFEPGQTDRGYSEFVTFQGISVDENDTQHFLDVWVSYRMACRHAIRHLKRFGFSGEQAYVLLAAAPVQGRISCMLEHPNVCTTLAVPSAIFDFDIGPGAEQIQNEPRGELARPS